MSDPYSLFMQRIMFRHPVLSLSLLLSLLFVGCAKEKSYELPTDQTGSTFTIISTADAKAFNGLYLKTKMQFKCKLYNVNTGAMKEVTNGEMVGTFGKI